MKNHPIFNFIKSDDPLSFSAAKFILEYKEEDDLIDYKLTLDIKSEKEWLELVKDVTAFANTFGGYIIFGINNLDKSIEGLDDEIFQILSDVDKIHQKINRIIEPELISLRTKGIEVENKKIVLLYIPVTKGKSYIISKDGSYKHPSGKINTLLRKGTLYVRRSGGNHLLDSHDLEELIERRIDQYKEKLLNKISRIVEAPKDSEIFILSQDSNDPNNKKFTIDSSPDSIPIKGMSFTISPEKDEEKIAAWSVISPGHPHIYPPKEILWEWYSKRLSLKITNKHKLSIAKFCLWLDVPCFYWLKGLKSEEIQSMVLESISEIKTGRVTSSMIVAAHLGKGFYNKCLRSLGSYKSKLPPKMKNYSKNIFDSHDKFRRPIKQSEDEFRESLLKELDEIYKTVDVKSKKYQPTSNARSRAFDIDCYLYAQNNKYK